MLDAGYDRTGGETLENTQAIDIDLTQIMPEYRSVNPLVRWLFNKRLDIAMGFLSGCKPKCLLDVGCGNGEFIKRVIREYSRQCSVKAAVHGIDTNNNVRSLSKYTAFFGGSVRTGSILHSSYPPEMFDFVTALDTLEHIEELSAAVNKIWHVLTPGGYLVTSEPTESRLYRFLRFLLKGTFSEKKGPCAGEHYYTAEQVDLEIQSLGFQRIKNRKIPFVWPFDLFHVNLYKKVSN